MAQDDEGGSNAAAAKRSEPQDDDVGNEDNGMSSGEKRQGLLNNHYRKVIENRENERQESPINQKKRDLKYDLKSLEENIKEQVDEQEIMTQLFLNKTQEEFDEIIVCNIESEDKKTEFSNDFKAELHRLIERTKRKINTEYERQERIKNPAEKERIIKKEGFERHEGYIKLMLLGHEETLLAGPLRNSVASRNRNISAGNEKIENLIKKYKEARTPQKWV